VVTKRAIILVMLLTTTMLLAPACTAQYTLTTSASPDGSGEVNPASGSYDEGSEVTLNATPAAGWVFSEWSGDATSHLSSITITMDADKSVTALFKAPPTAEISADPTTVRIGEEVSFNANSSADPDNNIVSYEWNFGDGNTASGRSVTHDYSRLGTYTARLTVTDSDGLYDTAEIQISTIPWGVIKIEITPSSWLNTPYLTSDIIAEMLEPQGFTAYDGSGDYDAILDINYQEKKGGMYGPIGQHEVSGHGTDISCWISLYDKAGISLHKKIVTASTSHSVNCSSFYSVDECLRADAVGQFNDKLNDIFDDIMEAALEALTHPLKS
jgi:hypothetical protein